MDLLSMPRLVNLNGSGIPVELKESEILTRTINRYTSYNHKRFGRAVGKDTVSFANSKMTMRRWGDDFQNDIADHMDHC